MEFPEGWLDLLRGDWCQGAQQASCLKLYWVHNIEQKPFLKNNLSVHSSLHLRDRQRATFSESQDFETEVDGVDMDFDMEAPLEGEVMDNIWMQRYII